MPLRTYQFQVQALVTASSLSYSVSHALGLVSTATDGVRRTPSSELSLASEATWILQPYNGDSVESPLNLVQEASAFGFEGVESELGLVSLVVIDILSTEVVPQALNLSSVAEVRYGVRNLDAETELGLVSVVTKTFTGNITHALNLSQIAFRAFTPSNDLGLVQTVSAGKGKDAESDLDLTSTVLVNKSLNQNLSETNIVSQACTYFIESSCNRYSFNRFHGAGGVEPATKKLNYTNTFYMQSIDDGTVVTLRNPEMDDRQRYAFNRVNRNYFDGSPDVYSDTDWAVEQSQLYTIVANKRADLELLYTFLQDNLGREIIIKDWKGVTWVVVVVNPGDLYTEDGEGYWTLNFDVQGDAFDGEWFFNYMNLTTDASRAGSIYRRAATSGSVVEQNLGRSYDLTNDVTNLSEVNILSQEVSYVIE